MMKIITAIGQCMAFDNDQNPYHITSYIKGREITKCKTIQKRITNGSDYYVKKQETKQIYQIYSNKTKTTLNYRLLLTQS